MAAHQRGAAAHGRRAVWSALACFDGDEPACADPSPFPLARFVIQSVAWAMVVGLAAFAVLAAWRHRRTERLRWLAVVALAAPTVAALAANRLAEIPVLLF